MRVRLLHTLPLLALAAARPLLTTPELESRMLAAIDQVHSLRYTVTARERVGRKLLPMRSTVKLTTAPLRVYLKNDQAAEALYVAGQNDGKVLVYPGTFPYLTLSLDPNGSLMRRNQHHLVTQVGYGLIAGLLRDSDPAFLRSFRYAGDSTVGSRACYVLSSRYPAFRYVAYPVGTGETIASVAARFHCGEYRILERNHLSADDRLTAGQVLQVPNAYASRVVVLVDARSYLPASVAVYDDQGLYERYEFSGVVVNQAIPVAEFGKDYPGYKF